LRYSSPLSERYASSAMLALWSAQTRHGLWRRLWLALAAVVVVVTGAGDAFTAGCCLDFIPIQHNTSHAHCLSSIGVSHSISLAWLQYSC
jgi:hypothetical protein